MNEQRRQIRSAVTVRSADDDGAPEIVGHAAVFYDGTPETEFRIADDMVERIAIGAFDRAIAEHHDVRALVNHNPDSLLGRTEAGTLKLSTDSRGLAYTIRPPDTVLGRDTVTSIKRGDMTGSSFAFRIVRETPEDVPDDPNDSASRITTVYTIQDVDLFDISPVTYPAYDGADAASRADVRPVWCRCAGNVTERIQQRDAWRAEQAKPADTTERDARADDVLAGDDLEDRARRLDILG